MFNKERIKEFFSLFHSLEISWQIYSLVITYLVILIAALILRWEVGVMLLILLILVVIFFMFNYENFIRNINTIANRLYQSSRDAEEDSMNRAPIGILLYDNNQRVKWVNPAMQHIFGNKELLGELLFNIDEDFKKLMTVDVDRQWQTVDFMNRYYKVLHQSDTQSIYLIDVTEEMEIREQRKFDQLVFGYLFLDDYDEIVESMDDQQATNFDSVIINDVNQWAASFGIYTKRIDQEKFILLLNNKVLDQLEKSKFKFFDELRERNLARNTPLSISIGMAYPEDSSYQISDLSEQAQINLDLALGRGGDQIVVRSINGRARFYGGKTNPTERRSNIRSRLVFQALRTSVEQADKILITGHKTPDMDSIGSALGIYKIIKQFKRNARIVIKKDSLNSDIRDLLSLDQAQIYWDKIFVEVDEVEDVLTDKSLIIMVDHHRPALSEAESLINKHDVVIIDHHRRGEEFPSRSVLTYIEPYASSTAELVTEFFMNLRNTTEALNRFEATALLAGIIVDTNNFASRTGSRTFDVASYLKSRGANTSQIQRFLKEDLTSIIQRNKLIEDTEMVADNIAVIRASDTDIIDNVIAAQTADMLLDVAGVEASFVIYRRSEDKIGISARSLGTINVQIIMEQLGGGGHLSNAATQLADCSIDDVYEQLIEELNKD